MIVKNSVIEILAMFFPRLVIWVMENIREWDPIIWLWLCSISYRKNIATFSMTWSHTLTFSKTSDFHFCSGKIIVKISTIQFWTKFFNIIFDTLRRPDQHVKRKNPFWGGIFMDEKLICKIFKRLSNNWSTLLLQKGHISDKILRNLTTLEVLVALLTTSYHW